MGTEDSAVLEILDAEDESGTSITEIYEFLLNNEDIILTIDASAEADLRRGLALVKHRHKKRVEEEHLKSNGESKQLQFKILERIEHPQGEQIRIQIWLQAKASVRVHRMVVADKEIF